MNTSPAPSHRADGISSWPQRLALWVTNHPWTVVLLASFAAALSIFISLRHLALDANTDSLISPDRPFMVRYREFLDEFGDLEGLTIAVDPRGNDGAAQRAVDALVTELSALPGLPHVVGRVDPSEQWRLAAWSMPSQQLQDLLRARGAFPTLIQAKEDVRALCALESAHDLLSATVTGAVTAPRHEQESRVASALLLIDAVCPPPLTESLASPRPAEYLRSDGGSLLFVQMQPQKDFSSLATIEPLLRDVRGVMQRIQQLEPSIEIGLTGKPVLQADELATSNADTSRGTAIAVLLVVALLIVVFRSVLRPLLAALALGLTFACTYGVATVLVGRLNLLSLVFMLVLVSAGVDYGIHALSHHADWRRRVRPSLAPRCAMAGGFVPIWVGAATSAAVFYLALMTDFGGLRELGIIAGSGLLICALMMTVVLPALLTIAARAGMDKHWREEQPSADHVTSPSTHPGIPAHTARGVLMATIVVSAVSAALLPRISFESNLLKLQAEGLESIEWEHRILADSTSASWFGAILCADEGCVDRVRALAESEPTIGRTVSIRDVMPPSTPERARFRSEFVAACAAEAPPCPATSGTSVATLQAATAAARASLERLLTLGALGGNAADLVPLRERSERLRDLESKLQEPARSGEAALLAQNNASRAAQALLDIAQGAAAPQREVLPIALRDRLMSTRGTYLVSLLPKEDIWEPAPLAAFTEALTRIDGRATGVPFTVRESLTDMRDAFLTMSIWALATVAALVWIDLRSISATVVVISVLLLGMLWTFGCMSALGISLNLANFFGVPMLLGLGVDGAVHILHRAREGGDPIAWMWTRRAVILSAATTAAGFGTLLFASHRGLQSLGWLILVGSICTLLTAVVVLPSLLCFAPALAGSRQPLPDVGGTDLAGGANSSP